MVGYLKGEFHGSARASDDVNAVKLIVIGPIRSEYTTLAGLL